MIKNTCSKSITVSVSPTPKCIFATVSKDVVYYYAIANLFSWLFSGTKVKIKNTISLESNIMI